MRLHTYLTLAALAGLTLSACATSTVEKEWDCGAQPGLGCRTIAEIQNEIVQPGDAPNAQYIGAARVLGPDLQYQGVPMWEPDRIMKMFVGDFVDTSNNYHAESVVFVVVNEAGWAVK